eukprot:ANDGO_02442.mRNA.1 Pre-mRNA-splicing factor srp1
MSGSASPPRSPDRSLRDPTRSTDALTSLSSSSFSGSSSSVSASSASHTRSSSRDSRRDDFRPNSNGDRDGGERPRRIIYISRLPDDVTDNELLHEFRRNGRIRSCLVPRDEDNCCKGFAFIEYFDPRDADDAIFAFNNRRVFGRTLTVEYAKKPPRLTLMHNERSSSRDAPYDKRPSTRYNDDDASPSGAEKTQPANDDSEN